MTVVASTIGGWAVLAGILILAVIAVVVAYVVTIRIQQSRRGRGGPPAQPHTPGHVGRIWDEEARRKSNG